MDRNEVNFRTKTKLSISLGRKEVLQQMHKRTNADYAGKQKIVTMVIATELLMSRTMALRVRLLFLAVFSKTTT